ncbi:MAG: type 4a pilus biogenesis protein PilO [Sporomusaceae bacterium]|jgi:Tfp pilus assembly protein PilO|nr:type 4a pilus biogenesis protein PilO [Sporomusaceae bacterium]
MPKTNFRSGYWLEKIMSEKHFNFSQASRQKTLLLAITLFLAALCIWQFLLVPQAESKKLLAEKYAQQERQAQEVTSFFAQHPDYEQYTLKLDEKWETAQRMLPEQLEVSEFLLEIENTAKMAEVTVLDIKPLPKISRAGYAETSFEIIVRGNFEAMLDFAQSLESFERFIAVSAATIALSSAQEADKPVPELESKILLVIYSLD